MEKLKKGVDVKINVIPEFTTQRAISSFESEVKKEANKEFLEQSKHGINKSYEEIYSEWFTSLKFLWDFKKNGIRK